MKRILLLVVVILASAGAASAETRWCDLTGHGPQDGVVYPPIAKAARVSGLVMGYLKFTPDGKVTGFDPIQGPAMLRESLRQQLSTWTLQTRATGTEACQTLVVGDFRLCFDNEPCTGVNGISFEAGLPRFSVIGNTPRYICILDNAVIGPPQNPIRHVWYSTRHAFRKLFHRNQ